MLGLEPRFPAEREAKRVALLGAVESVRDVIAAHSKDSDELRTLAPASVEALHESGLFALKLPAELGGAEADPIVQMDVIEALAVIDPAASWCMFITAAITGRTGARLSDEAIAEIFVDNRFPCMAGSLKPDGRAKRVEGGYLVSGRWSWASGVRHAEYMSVVSFTDEPKGVLSFLVPISEVEIVDNWRVMGMQGTGSCDIVLADAFVPDLFVSDPTTTEIARGGALYRLGMPGYVVNEHAAFALGLGRRALELVSDRAIERKRGYTTSVSIADRAVFQRAVSEGGLRLRAARLLNVEVLERLFEAAHEGLPPPALQAEARAAAVLATDDAIDVVSTLFRYAGGSAVYLENEMQRCLRDIYTVQSHLVVSDSAYEIHGQLLLGVRHDAPLG